MCPRHHPREIDGGEVSAHTCHKRKHVEFEAAAVVVSAQSSEREKLCFVERWVTSVVRVVAMWVRLDCTNFAAADAAADAADAAVAAVVVD
jgi:hypothetical protein